MKDNFFKINLLYLYVSLFLIFSNSCSKTPTYQEYVKVPPLDVLYRSAFKEYENNKWNNAIDLFQKVEINYYFTDWAPKASLMIMYIYYESREYYKALEYVEKFKKNYPTNENISYVEYMSGLIFYEQIDVMSRDQTYAKESLKIFNKVRKKYPTTKYAEDAIFKIDLINEQLAGKQIYRARYYMNKSQWIPAIKALNNVINNYDTTIYSQEALHRLVEIYYTLGNIKEARKYAAILGYNFNDSDWYKKTYNIVSDKKYLEKNITQKRKLKDNIKKLFKFSE